tara:strand:+ start:4309 stop:4482 length:174 start_codon:yes stop_codon:yes gene_type:complete
MDITKQILFNKSDPISSLAIWGGGYLGYKQKGLIGAVVGLILSFFLIMIIKIDNEKK